MNHTPERSTSDLWARFRFSVVGSLLSSPPARGELQAALEALAEKVAPHETIYLRSPDMLFDRVIELKQADSFVQLIGTFLCHYKGGGYRMEECAAKGEKLKLGKRATAFLSCHGRSKAR